MHGHPWVETHGYHRMSLRDVNRGGWKTPDPWVETHGHLRWGVLWSSLPWHDRDGHGGFLAFGDLLRHQRGQGAV